MTKAIRKSPAAFALKPVPQDRHRVGQRRVLDVDVEGLREVRQRAVPANRRAPRPRRRPPRSRSPDRRGRSSRCLRQPSAIAVSSSSRVTKLRRLEPVVDPKGGGLGTQLRAGRAQAIARRDRPQPTRSATLRRRSRPGSASHGRALWCPRHGPARDHPVRLRRGDRRRVDQPRPGRRPGPHRGRAQAPAALRHRPWRRLRRPRREPQLGGHLRGRARGGHGGDGAGERHDLPAPDRRGPRQRARATRATAAARPGSGTSRSPTTTAGSAPWPG